MEWPALAGARPFWGSGPGAAEPRIARARGGRATESLGHGWGHITVEIPKSIRDELRETRAGIRGMRSKCTAAC